MKQKNNNSLLTSLETKLFLIGLFFISIFLINYESKSNPKRFTDTTSKKIDRSLSSVSNVNTDELIESLEVQKNIELQTKEYLNKVSQRIYQEANLDQRSQRFLETSSTTYSSGENQDNNLRDYEVFDKNEAFLNELKEEESTEELEWDVAAGSLEDELY